MNLGECHIGRWNTIVQFSRLSAIQLSLSEPVRIWVQTISHNVHLREPGKAESKVRIRVHSTLKRANSQLYIPGLVISLKVAESSQVILIRGVTDGSSAVACHIALDRYVHEPPEARYGFVLKCS